MRKIVFLIYLLSTPSLFAQNIPEDWMGDWYGILEIQTPKGTVASINMELHLAKTDKANNWAYTIVYDDGKNRDERKYNLIKSDSITGLYEVDENNGIIIHEVKMGNKMFQRFEVMDNVIYGITTYEKNKITWEIVSDNEKISFQSGRGDEDSPIVNTYFPTNYQKAVLTKKKPTLRQAQGDKKKKPADGK